MVYPSTRAIGLSTSLGWEVKKLWPSFLSVIHWRHQLSGRAWQFSVFSSLLYLCKNFWFLPDFVNMHAVPLLAKILATPRLPLLLITAVSDDQFGDALWKPLYAYGSFSKCDTVLHNDGIKRPPADFYCWYPPSTPVCWLSDSGGQVHQTLDTRRPRISRGSCTCLEQPPASC